MIKVSVIVPVYNTSKYLAKCIDSLINQTLKEIEIIVINDKPTISQMAYAVPTLILWIAKDIK